MVRMLSINLILALLMIPSHYVKIFAALNLPLNPSWNVEGLN